MLISLIFNFSSCRPFFTTVEVTEATDVEKAADVVEAAVVVASIWDMGQWNIVLVDDDLFFFCENNLEITFLVPR